MTLSWRVSLIDILIFLSCKNICFIREDETNWQQSKLSNIKITFALLHLAKQKKNQFSKGLLNQHRIINNAIVLTIVTILKSNFLKRMLKKYAFLKWNADFWWEQNYFKRPHSFTFSLKSLEIFSFFSSGPKNSLPNTEGPMERSQKIVNPLGSFSATREKNNKFKNATYNRILVDKNAENWELFKNFSLRNVILY